MIDAGVFKERFWLTPANKKQVDEYEVGNVAYLALKALTHFYRKPRTMATQPNSETLAERVKRLREATLVEFNGEEKPMTQKQLAERCGCDVGTISRIENGQTPLVTTAKRIAKAFNITLDELMDGI